MAFPPSGLAARVLAAVSALLLVCSLGGCTLVSVATQSRPICSWDNSPPSGADALCTRTFSTLRSLAVANTSGNNHLITHAVTNPGVAGRIARFGARMRAEGNFTLHVVPSLTLRTVSRRTYAAEFYLMGITRKREIKAAQEVLVVRDLGNRVVVVGDQSGPEW